jgi:hypothetical protein
MKSSFSGAGNCVDVEIKRNNKGVVDRVSVSDTKMGLNGPALIFNRDEWGAFVKGVKAGEFDLV